MVDYHDFDPSDVDDELFIDYLVRENSRLKSMLIVLGFCYDCGGAMPCLECGKGL